MKIIVTPQEAKELADLLTKLSQAIENTEFAMAGNSADFQEPAGDSDPDEDPGADPPASLEPPVGRTAEEPPETAAAEDCTSAPGMPEFDEEIGLYAVDGSYYIGKEIWNRARYREFFNHEIQRLRKEGKSRRFIANRIKVSETAITNRIERDCLA